MKTIFAIVVALALAGCVSTPNLISGTNVGQSTNITNPTIVTDLQSAAYNLDQAVVVGALLPDDPAPACIHAVLVKSGIEVPAGAAPAQSFVPKKDGVASAGAIAYIIAQQARRLSKEKLTVDPSCEALVGRVVIDGARDFNKVGVAAIRLLAP